MSTNPQARSYVVLATSLVLCLVCAVYVMPFVPDEAYFTFSFAENIANGNGIVLSSGDVPSEGYSNFLWVMFCALLAGVGVSLPGGVAIAGITIALLNVVVLWALLRRRGFTDMETMFPLFMLATSGPFVAYAISGLETPLYALAILLLILAMDRLSPGASLARWLVFALALFALSLVRIEGALVLVIAPAMILRSALSHRAKPAAATGKGKKASKRTAGSPPATGRDRRNALVAVATVVVLVVAYNVWRVAYFGELLPIPLAAVDAGGIIASWGENLRGYFDVQGYLFPPLGYYFVALILVAVVGRQMSTATGAARTSESVLFVVVIVHAVIYLSTRDPLPGMHYYAALAPPLLLFGTYVLRPLFGDEGAEQRKLPLALTAVAVIALNVSSLAQLGVSMRRVNESMEKCVSALGEWLIDVAPDGSRIAVSGSPAVSYYSGFRSIDIDPQSVRNRRIAESGYSTDDLLRYDPNVVVLRADGQLRPTFPPEQAETVRDRRFQQRYRHLASARASWYNDESYWVFIRADSPVVSEEVMERFPYGMGTIRAIRLRLW